MHRRLFTLMTLGMTVQGAMLLYSVAEGPVLYAGLFCLVLSVCAIALTFRGHDISLHSVTLTWSQLGGIAATMLGLGWVAYPVARWFDDSFGLVTGLLTVANVMMIWGGIAMIRGHERYRLLDPDETARSRIEQIGWSTHPLVILRDEALRSIGVFGLLFVPTMLFVVVTPSLSPMDPVVYLPAAVFAVLHAVAVVWVRLSTGAGPHYTQVFDTIRGQ